MQNAQSLILSSLPPAGRFLTLGLTPDASAPSALERVGRLRLGGGMVVGLGDPLLRAAGESVQGFGPFQR